MSATLANLWVGTAGWSYDDWRGLVYPSSPARGFRPLTYLSRFVNAVEVNSTFYRLPGPELARKWPSQVPERFRFTFKLTRTFTHERAQFPANADADAFKAAIAPVQQAGQLGPLLIQFPWSFRFEPSAVDWLQRVRDAFCDHDRAIEVRHSSWAAPEALDAIRRAGGICNIDQPLLRDHLGRMHLVFGRTAYVRLHGRNADNWFRDDQPAYERYNYLYSDSELREWLDGLRRMLLEADDVYAITNNHYRGQAVANAIELRAMLEPTPPAAPATLLSAYPRLREVASPVDAEQVQPRDKPRQSTLFEL